jgi:hypothetical protein
MVISFAKVPFGVSKTCYNHGNQGQQDIEEHENEWMSMLNPLKRIMLEYNPLFAIMQAN